MIYRKQKGFGLLEVLISLLVISIGVAGIVSLQKHMRAKSAEAEEYLISARLAQQSLEDVKVFTDTSFGVVVSAGTLNILSGATTASAAGITFTRTVEVTNNPFVASGGLTTATQLKQVKVQYDWTSLNGDTKSQSLAMPVSPISPFEADNYFTLGKNGTAVGGGAASGGVSTNPPVDLDPSNQNHVPPLYVPNYEYSNGDQVTVGGIKYACVTGDDCRKHTTFGPGTTHFKDAWTMCRDSSLNPTDCPKCYHSAGYEIACPLCSVSGSGEKYSCPPIPAPSTEPPPAP